MAPSRTPTPVLERPAWAVEVPERRSSGQAAPAQVSVTMLGVLPPWRGVAPYTRHLVEALEPDGGLETEFVDFTALYPRWLYPGGDPRDRDGARPSFRRVRVRLLLAWYNPLSWLWAGLTLRGRVVHAQWWSFALAPVYLVVLGLARLRGRRVVLTLHNVAPHEASRWRRWLYRLVFGCADHFIVHSARNAADLAATYPRASGRTTVVPHGLLTVSKPQGLSRTQARRELGLPEDRPVLLAFGNIRPYKGLDVLLRALRRVVDAGQDALLLVAGEPWGDFAPYRRLIYQLGLASHVRMWLDFVPEERIEAFFAAADAAVFPYTHFDAQSGAAALALSFGVPLVVSDVGGLPELAGEARVVVPPNDPRALAEAICAVLGDEGLRDGMAAGSRRKATELGWARIAERTAAVYCTVAAEETGRRHARRPVLGQPIRHGYSGVEKRLAALRRFAEWRGARALDLGCGNGAYTLEIAREAAFVVGVDVEPERLREFAARANGTRNVAIGRAAGEGLPFANGQLDAVFCIETLEHVGDERETLAEVRRVLRPGGVLLLTVPNKWYLFETHGLRARWLPGSNRYPFASWLPKAVHSRVANARIYTARELRTLLTEAGFEDARLDWMLPPFDRVHPAPLRAALRRLVGAAEGTALRRFGVSIVAVATKPAGTRGGDAV